MAAARPEVIVGAVAYDPKVVTIWDGFKQWFEAHGQPIDYVLFHNYERQVEAHFAGVLDIAWNSPLAWIESQRLAKVRGRSVRALVMRDTDRDLTSVVMVRANSPVRKVADLRGKKVGVGAKDSPQATLIPLLHLAEAGLEPRRDFDVREHDVLLGKHGDHVGGEREAVRALIRGEVDAATVLDANHLAFSRDGTVEPGSTRVVAQTAPYDHCNFTFVGDRPSDKVDLFAKLLLGMSYEDPAVRPLFDLEGLKSWLPSRTSGYAQLERAVDRFRHLERWLASAAAASAAPSASSTS